MIYMDPASWSANFDRTDRYMYFFSLWIMQIKFLNKKDLTRGLVDQPVGVSNGPSGRIWVCPDGLIFFGHVWSNPK